MLVEVGNRQSLQRQAPGFGKNITCNGVHPLRAVIGGEAPPIT